MLGGPLPDLPSDDGRTTHDIHDPNVRTPRPRRPDRSCAHRRARTRRSRPRGRQELANTYADAVGEYGTTAANDITSLPTELWTRASLTVSVHGRGARPANPFRADTVRVGRAWRRPATETTDFDVIYAGTSFINRVQPPTGFTTLCSASSKPIGHRRGVLHRTRQSCIGSPRPRSVPRSACNGGERGSDQAPSPCTAQSIGARLERGTRHQPRRRIRRVACSGSAAPGFNNAHFFATNEDEADGILDYGQLAFEGIAFGADRRRAGGVLLGGSGGLTGSTPRVPVALLHAGRGEETAIVANDRNWSYEGVAYCALPARWPAPVPLYRFWSPNFGKHFFTADKVRPTTSGPSTATGPTRASPSASCP